MEVRWSKLTPAEQREQLDRVIAAKVGRGADAVRTEPAVASVRVHRSRPPRDRPGH